MKNLPQLVRGFVDGGVIGGPIYKVVAAQNGVIDADKTMALLKGMKFESPRGPLTIDPDTRDAVQNVYIKQIQKRNGKLVTTEVETIPMVRDPLKSDRSASSG